MLADRLGHEKVSTTLNTYSHLFPHKQQELVHSLESLQATDSPTPEPPSDNPLLEAAGITCEVPQTQDNGSDVTIRPLPKGSTIKSKMLILCGIPPHLFHLMLLFSYRFQKL